jgi:hypothetical protein
VAVLVDLLRAKLVNIPSRLFTLSLALSALVNQQDFPVFVWRQEFRGRELPERLLAPFGGTNVEADDEAGWALDSNVDFYIGHAPGRNDLHLRRTEAYQAWFQSWFESRDETLNLRQPCLTQIETRQRLFANLEANLSARSGQHGIGISLGDEVSLTPWGDPLDVCESPTCKAAWTTWCQREGLEPMEMVSTDTVRLELASENYRSLGPWLARRRFHQSVVLELLEQLAEHSRKLSPSTPVGLLGLGGQTAFGGVAIERALRFLDFVEVYSVDNARELLFTELADPQRSWATIFLEEAESGSANGASLRVWEHVLRGGDGLVLWSDQLLASKPTWLDRLARTVKDVREVRAQAPTLKSADWGRPHSVALLHSADSLAFNWLKDALLDGPTWPNRLAGYQRKHGTLEQSQRSWFRLLEDAGWLPGALSIEALSADSAQQFPLLVLSHITILDDEQAEQLEAYLVAGGEVIVEGEFARFDRFGAKREAGLLDRLSKQHPQQVHASLNRLLEYPGLRLQPKNARAEILRTSVQDRARPSLSRSLFRVKGGELPWLTETRPTDAGGWLCMALENATTPYERSHLKHLRVELLLEANLAVEWIHPPRTIGRVAQLPAGDALVFRLHRIEPNDKGSAAE